MNRLIKILFSIVASLAVIMTLAVTAIYLISDNMLNKPASVPAEKMAIPTDAASIQEGARLTTIRGCNGCHMPDLSGDPQFSVSALGSIASPNITKGGATANYTDEDWLRAVRHGVAKDGRALLIMDSREYNSLSEQDISKIIAYVKSVPAVQKPTGERNPSFLGRALLATGQIDFIAASKIPPVSPPPAAIPAAVTPEFGKYLATACQGCHNTNYSGGDVPGRPPGSIKAANLTQITKDKYDDAKFINFFRTTINWEGRRISDEIMPVTPYGKAFTDTELKALLSYFKSVPVRENGK